MSEKYNGWSNYATWRIHLEIFDGAYDSHTAESAKEAVEEIKEIKAGKKKGKQFKDLLNEL